MKKEFNEKNEPYPYTILNFEYIGFSGHLLGGEAEYKGTFINWSGDPVLVRMLCSDGRVRLIPIFALKNKDTLPPDETTYRDRLLFFGEKETKFTQ